MGVNFVKAYKAIQIKGLGEIDVATNININVPDVRSAFNRAAQNDGINAPLLKQLIESDAPLIRNNMTYKWQNFQPQAREIAVLLQKQYLEGALSSEDEELLDQKISGLIKDSDLQPPESVEKFIRQQNEMFVESLKEKNTNKNYIDRQDSYAQDLDRGLNTMRRTSGCIYRSNDVPYFIVPQYKTMAEAWFLESAPVPGPGTTEQMEFLTALHEAEHLSNQRGAWALSRYPEAFLPQIKEIDADLAVIRYLNNAIANNEPNALAIKNRWLQERQVRSFIHGLDPADKDLSSHDTATFIRVLETKGNPQIDLQKFNQEKAGLFNKIKEKMDVTWMYDGAMKIGQIMGAVKDVLADDDAQNDKTKRLTKVQRAEAESFLADAEQMGYDLQKEYPKAKMPDPQEKISSVPPITLPASRQTISG